MSLIIDLAKSEPSALSGYTIEQIVAICGDGKLKDNSACSSELRSFLATEPVTRLADHASYCLENKFEKGGFVLQDVVNEIGRRLGYDVTNGRYQGVVNDIGNDGLWFASGQHLVVEVKTSDAYRINLDTIQGYVESLRQSKLKGEPCATLLVVGRQDTGDLEAQVRGSRHAWSIRLISVDALVKLMLINQEASTDVLVDKVRKILLPFEYTRVDNIVDLVFEAAQEAGAQAQMADDLSDEDDGMTGEQKALKPFTTDIKGIDQKRLQIVQSHFTQYQRLPYSREKRTMFTSDIDASFGAVCAVSKRYPRDHQPYWYALHPAWLEFLKEKDTSHFLLGCMDRDTAYALPKERVLEALPKLNTTDKGGRYYWHLALKQEGDDLLLNMSKAGEKLSLQEYAFPLI